MTLPVYPDEIYHWAGADAYTISAWAAEEAQREVENFRNAPEIDLTDPQTDE